MRGVNKAIIVGNLGADPEVRHLDNDQTVANLSVATNRRYTTRDGEQREDTEWHRIVLWGRLAEIAEKYLQKGNTIFVEGRLQTNKWEDRNGNERYTTEINAYELSMLDKKSDSPSPVSSSPSPQQSTPASPPEEEDESDEALDDLPF